MRIVKYSDSGHGWYKVKKSLLSRLGISHRITAWSFERGDYAYIEEDCDASELFLALERAGIDVEVKCHYSMTNSKIRGYRRYSDFNDLAA